MKKTLFASPKTPSSEKSSEQSFSSLTGNEHEFLKTQEVRNCIGCGFIYSTEVYAALDSCTFCSRPLTLKSKKENRRRKEEGENEEGLLKAEALRDRLVAYDRESRGLPKVGLITDDDVIQ